MNHRPKHPILLTLYTIHTIQRDFLISQVYVQKERTSSDQAQWVGTAATISCTLRQVRQTAGLTILMSGRFGAGCCCLTDIGAAVC